MSELDVEKLKVLQKQLKWEDKNDNDFQASPRFWVIYDYRWIPTWEGDADRYSIYIPEYAEGYEIESFVEEVLRNEDGLYDEEDLECLDWCSDSYFFESEVLEWVSKHIDEDAYLVPERKEGYIVENTLFITKKAAKEHIERNKHHYSKSVHTFAMTAWRSSEVELVWNMLGEIDWDRYERELKNG